MEEGKTHVKSRNFDGASGADRRSYADVLAVENDLLTEIANRCIQNRDKPSSWRITLIAAILKNSSKPAHLADSYRTIGLESCVLKFIMLLIHFRVVKWIDANGLLPPTQNGFRQGYRTNNNAFILRGAIEKARALNKSLYVAFVDVSNAFPSARRALLWVKLYRLGMGGKIFDWVRMVYEDMQYFVRSGGFFSDMFTSDIGVLIGDPISPDFWNLLFADINIPAHPDDVLLLATVISHLEHADDLCLLSTSVEGLQQHLTDFARWAALNFLLVNALKSACMIFGPLPAVLPRLVLADGVVPVVEEWTYVGVLFVSTSRNIFTRHYEEKAHQARNVANVIIASKAFFADLPVPQGRTLYTARADPPSLMVLTSVWILIRHCWNCWKRCSAPSSDVSSGLVVYPSTCRSILSLPSGH